MERRAITIHGTVQGVGFRPFVYTLACRLKLAGFVKNQGGSVTIEAEGDSQSLDEFVEQLRTHAPPLSHIESMLWQPRTPIGESRFVIAPSEDHAMGAIVVAPDSATCDDCLAELLDPADRRFNYPFINCTNCGPRLTIVTAAPYDRLRTTMSNFMMCAACRAEYENPSNRRFHAQPIACPVCGPSVQALHSDGEPVHVDQPLKWFAAALRDGKIGAMKGLGGYHLICDARDETAVAELRSRKHRDEKPFAVMVQDVEAAERLCDISPAECELLTSVRRPIVLLRRRDNAALAASIAPRNHFLGLMLPYTPLHHLLLRAMHGSPLVMTSGNRSDEPIAYEEPDAIERLTGIADVFLVHNRPIHVRCDDSVTRIVDGVESPVRRSRGYAPQPITLPFACAVPMLAVGAQQKSTFALGVERQAVISHHLGDLDHFEAYRAFERDIALYENLFAVRPALIVHDQHPDYAYTRCVIRRATELGVERVAVQHHHAHMASCMAEHGLAGPVIGVTFDGTGYGTDGAIWGGEFLVGDCCEFTRAAHLRYVALPGGDRAIKEPWRMAVSHLADAGATCRVLEGRVNAATLRATRQMIERKFNSPLTSSAGRLFDAVAAIAGVRDTVTSEGQAAIELEQLAAGVAADGSYPFELVDDGAGPIVIDTRPLIRAAAEEADAGMPAAKIARKFQSTMVDVIAVVCGRIHRSSSLSDVVLSGGVFMNALLASETATRLSADGLSVHRHRLVPPNDGGISLGQLAIVAARRMAISVKT
ncbi:carbamoyltransferase HypF [soil metagenome]